MRWASIPFRREQRYFQLLRATEIGNKPLGWYGDFFHLFPFHPSPLRLHLFCHILLIPSYASPCPFSFSFLFFSLSSFCYLIITPVLLPLSSISASVSFKSFSSSFFLLFNPFLLTPLFPFQSPISFLILILCLLFLIFTFLPYILLFIFDLSFSVCINKLCDTLIIYCS